MPEKIIDNKVSKIVPETLPKLHGWLIIDKPSGHSSFDVIRILRKMLRNMGYTKQTLPKIGHAGTLDPSATGVLPIAIGDATKLVEMLSNSNKIYEFDIIFGSATTTDDADGEVVEKTNKIPNNNEVEACLSNFKGLIKQVPPKYSAIKIDGQRAYKLARKNQDFEIKAREVNIFDLQVIEPLKDNKIRLKAKCSKGTYIRSLAVDIAKSLGSLGHVDSLRRLEHGKFTIKEALELDSYENMVYKPTSLSKQITAFKEGFKPIEATLDDILVVSISLEQTARIRNGLSIEANIKATTKPVYLFYKEQLVAIAKFDENKLKPKKVFNHNN